MTPCLIFFSTQEGSITSKVIRDTGDRQISHAGLVFWSSEFEQWMVLDAIGCGWVIRSYAEFVKQGNRIVRLFSFSGDLFAGVLANKALIGVPYDYSALVGRGVLKWWHAITGGNVKRNYWNDHNKWYCNEIIAGKVLPAAGCDLGPNIDMDPFQLADILDKHPAFRNQNPELLGKP